MSKQHTIGSYLIDKLSSHGVGHIFGVPGDYVLGLYKQLEDSKLKVINTCDEQGAGFAADAYARVNGLGAVCVTYCVGGLKVANTTAQAFAEKSPVVVISGAPGTNERTKTPLLHHRVRDFDTQLKVFEQLTVASTVLDDPRTACSEIDRVFAAALRYKRPVYIELPRDMVSAPADPPQKSNDTVRSSDPVALDEALREAVGIISAAKKPVILAGVEMHRFGLQDALLKLLDKTKIPVASTILSKSVVVENHPQYLGVYEGAMGREEVREYIESSDCLILLGVFMSDVNLGIFTAHLDQGKSISVTSEKVSIQHHSYDGVEMDDFIAGLIAADMGKRKVPDIPNPPLPEPANPTTGKPMTVRYLFQRLNSFLDDNTIVIADPGDAMFAAIDMNIHCATEFLSPAYYTSLGFAVPASIGAQLANPQLRPLVLVGDGAFQMTGMEVASIARFGLTPIIIVLNNQGYGTERPMLDGAFNDIPSLNYARIPELLSAGKGYDIHTEDQLECALQEAQKHTDSFCIFDVHLDPADRSMALERLTTVLGKRVK
ncbi:MAG: alpha-keto acid decarboxylase family protein [Phycisphaerae bacterium]|nr:alpha-keto acid decarboxylase family protein [Phycisphaerae bacterium]